MEFLEKDLEEIIFNADKKILSEKGLRIKGKLFRQLKIGNYGIADLVGVEKEYLYTEDELNNSSVLNITVYKLKKDKIDSDTFLQALGYLKGIQSYIDKRKPNFYFEINYNIVLIGKSIAMHSEFLYLSDFLIDFLKNYIYSYHVDGIEFEQTGGYSLIDEGFKL